MQDKYHLTLEQNLYLAKRNLIDSIWKSAKIEGINVTFPQTYERNGTYGGQAGEKEGITIDGTYWIVKYPKSTKGMRGDVLSYMTAPLSEYIGSHIYEILGIDVHQTILGIRNGKLEPVDTILAT